MMSVFILTTVLCSIVLLIIGLIHHFTTIDASLLRYLSSNYEITKHRNEYSNYVKFHKTFLRDILESCKQKAKKGLTNHKLELYEKPSELVHFIEYFKKKKFSVTYNDLSEVYPDNGHYRHFIVVISW